MSALLASFFEVSVLFSFLPEINGTPCLWMGPEEQENSPQWPSRTSAVITLLVSRTGTFIFLKKGQTSASRSVERGELCLCLMSMHLWQEEAHHTDFFWHPESPDLRFHFCFISQNAKTFSQVECSTPWWQHLTLWKNEEDFSTGFDAMIYF